MSIDEFPLAWRWTQPSHAVLPAEVLASILPMQSQETEILYLRGEKLRSCNPPVTHAHHAAENEDATRAWLKALPLPPDARVSVVWDRTTGISVPWHAFLTYWDDFCYPSSDDLFVFPEAGNAVLASNHNEVFEFVESAV